MTDYPDDLVERVARHLCRAADLDPDWERHSLTGDPSETKVWTYFRDWAIELLADIGPEIERRLIAELKTVNGAMQGYAQLGVEVRSGGDVAACIDAFIRTFAKERGIGNDLEAD